MKTYTQASENGRLVYTRLFTNLPAVSIRGHASFCHLRHYQVQTFVPIASLANLA